MLSFTQHVSKLCGYAPAVPTPFAKDGQLDLGAFEAFCDLQINQGATALVVCGTTGEAPTLSQTEERTLVAAAVNVAKKRVPVIAGAGSNSTEHAIVLTKDAEEAGADAVLSVVPYYNKPTQRGLYAHFARISESTELPVLLYDVPSRTACALADETITRLAVLPGIIGLKDATGDATRPLRLKRLVPDNFRLLSGDDARAFAFLTQGGHGCISVTSNVAPGLCRNLFLSTRRGQLTHAQRLAVPVARLTELLFKEASPAPLKYALSLFSLMNPAVRLPLVEASERLQDNIEALLGGFSLSCPDELISTLQGDPIRSVDLMLDKQMSYV